MSVTGTFANGTLFNLVAGSSTGANVTYDADGGISVDYMGAGISFTGTSLTADEVTYEVTIDSEEIGVSGTVSFTSVSSPSDSHRMTQLTNPLQLAPSHYSCSTTPGASETIMPHVFWTNALPDATATVNVTFADATTTMQFLDGVGYHDKNWGDAAFAGVVGSWYWGHAHVGPYSLVWFDTLDLAGVNYVSGFVARDGEVLVSSCAEGAVSVRPWGENSAYPPTVASGVMQGIEVVFALGDGTVLSANVTRGTIVMDYEESVYIRALGSVEGGLEGGEVYQGRGVFEQFALTA